MQKNIEIINETIKVMVLKEKAIAKKNKRSPKPKALKNSIFSTKLVYRNKQHKTQKMRIKLKAVFIRKLIPPALL